MYNRFSNNIVFIMLLFCAISFISAEEQKEVNIASIDYPPYYGPNLEDNGFLAQIIQESFEAKGYSVNFDFISWSDALEKTKEGEYDAIATLWYRQDREEFYAYSDALPSNELVFCKLLNEETTFNTFEDLSEKKIGVVKDYSYPEKFIEAGLETVEKETDSEILGSLFSKEVDLIIIDKGQAKYLTRKNYPSFENSLDCLENSLTTNPQYLGFSKNKEGYEQTLQDFNSGLRKLITEGRFNEIIQNQGYDEFKITSIEDRVFLENTINYATFLYFVAFLAAILLFMYFFTKINKTNREFFRTPTRKLPLWKKILIASLLATAIPLLFVGILNLGLTSSAISKSSIQELENKAQLKKEQISLGLSHFGEDIYFLRGVPPIQGIIRAKDNGGIDPVDGSTEELWKKRLETIFEEMEKSRGFYNQIRYLDETGKELVRVDSRNGNIEVIRGEHLQNKANRYYFSETMSLDQGELFISELDLNKEGNPPQIEVPHNPVIRVATPIFDVKGNKRGIIITNIFAKDLLESLATEDEKNYFYLLDQEGFLLQGPNEEQLWGGPQNLDTGKSVYDLFEPYAGQFLSGEEKTITEDKELIFTYSSVLYNPLDKEKFWVILEAHPKKEIFEELYLMRNTLLIVFFISLLASAGASLYFSRTISRPIEKLNNLAEKIRKRDFSERVEITTGDELEELGKTFNDTLNVLENLEEERKQIDKAKTEFLSITSHELRSPMTPMKAQLQMVLGDYFGKTNKKQKESLEIVLRNTERLDRIILDFLEVSRIEAARLKFNFLKNTDLIKTTESLIKEMEGFMPEKNISIELETSGNIPKIEVDPDRVNQVLRNLINNAKKFSKEKSKIKVKIANEGDYLVFSVSDGGIGMDQKDLQRIFEPFYQAEQTIYREHQGTGLGLAICKGIVESQKGKIWAESKKGKGTKFSFTIPMKPVRDIRSIRLLFSETKGKNKQLKKLFVEYLGPIGDSEFENIPESNHNYETISKYFLNLKRIGVIEVEKYEKIRKELRALFNVNLKEEAVSSSLTEEIKYLYQLHIGPSGTNYFNNLENMEVNHVIGNINLLEEKGIIASPKASKLRDNIIALFRRKSPKGKIKEEKASKENLKRKKSKEDNEVNNG